MEEHMKPPLPEPIALEHTQQGWGCGMKLLWGYSVLVICGLALTIVLTLWIPTEKVSPEQERQDAVYFSVALLPVVYFIVLMGIQNLRRKKP